MFRFMSHTAMLMTYKHAYMIEKTLIQPDLKFNFRYNNSIKEIPLKPFWRTQLFDSLLQTPLNLTNRQADTTMKVIIISANIKKKSGARFKVTMSLFMKFTFHNGSNISSA